MYRKSLQIGLIFGILISLVMGVYVAGDEITQVIPEWKGLNIPGLPHDVIRAFSLAAAGALLLFVGTLAAMRVRAVRLQDGFRSGAISGLVAAIVLFVSVASPFLALRGMGEVYEYLLDHPDVLESIDIDAIEDPEQIIASEIDSVELNQAWQTSLVGGFLILSLGFLVGGLEGFVYTLLRRIGGRAAVEEETPPLLDLLHQGKPLLLTKDREHALRAGLLGGTIIGFFLSLESLLFLSSHAAAEWGELIIEIPFGPGSAQGILGRISTPLIVLVPLCLLFWGGLGVLMLRRPPSRFGSRFLASMHAGTAAGVLVISLLLISFVNVGASFLPVFISASQGSLLSITQMHFVTSLAFVAYPAFTLLLVASSAITGFFMGLPFVLLSAFLWPRRPVDRAATIVGHILRNPNKLLPQVYALFQNDCEAEEVLSQVAQQFSRKKMPPPATVAAAYHTLCQYPERTDALKAIVDTLNSNPDWHWRTEIGELHRFLQEGLQVRNVHHLSAVRPLPEEQTSSLPVVLRQVGEHLSHVVAKVKKAQQLDDPSNRTIYLNNALEAIAEAERLVAQDMAPSKDCGIATPFPEQRILSFLLPRWQKVLYENLRDLRGRAILRIELQTQRATFMPRLPLYFRVTNAGLNVAEQVRINLDRGANYQLTPESEARIEMLPPGEVQMVELTLEPRTPRPMRVLLHVLYNDAVEENRELTFADEVIFTEAERPFQRIFPIPYVTGTPLKTSEMFFGRQDVFAYVSEHLLGAYQNNIIVLHGQRRTGKTSVLYQLPEILRDTHHCVLLDMQGIAARNEAEFFYTLSDEITYALGREGLQVELPPHEDYEERPEFTFRSRFLRGLLPALGDKHLLLLFDEFEELQHHVEDGHIGAGIFNFLRNLMQHEEKVDFLFSGTHKLEELAAEYWSILFNIATYKKISFLERGEVERLIAEPVAPFGMEYDPMAVEHIYGVTAGHPFLTQLVCHEMVAYHNESERSYITVADVDVVLERIAERGEAHFKFVWAEANPMERTVLLAMAELLVHADAATAPEITTLSERRGRCVGEEEIVGALVRLESRDIVARTAPGSERFRFRVDLVRRWIVRNPQLADTVVLEQKPT